MKPVTPRRLAVIPLFVFAVCVAYQYLPAQQKQDNADIARFPGAYEVHVTAGKEEIHLISDVAVIEIGGEPFLSAKLIDDDSYEQGYRGKTCLLSVKRIVSMQQRPEPEQ